MVWILTIGGSQARVGWSWQRAMTFRISSELVRGGLMLLWSTDLSLMGLSSNTDCLWSLSSTTGLQIFEVFSFLGPLSSWTATYINKLIDSTKVNVTCGIHPCLETLAQPACWTPVSPALIYDTVVGSGHTTVHDLSPHWSLEEAGAAITTECSVMFPKWFISTNKAGNRTEGVAT